MAKGKYININYPFKNSDSGFFLDLTSTDKSAIKSDLMHLILTRKGQRLYNPVAITAVNVCSIRPFFFDNFKSLILLRL